LRRTALALIAVAALAGLSLYALTADRPFGMDWSEKSLGEWVKSLGPWGGIGIIGLMVLHSLVPFPAEVVAFLAGELYGVVWGTVFAWTGAMLGALLAFGLARIAGRDAVDALIPAAARQKAEELGRTRSVDGLLLARLIPVISFNLINYAAGLTRVGWWTFIWTTGVGILPLTVFFVYLGERMQDRSWQEWLLIAGLGLAFWAAIHGVRSILHRPAVDRLDKP
jgi:uncharacterized membrane protein YdjX (TVP38/TMEM64 family)